MKVMRNTLNLQSEAQKGPAGVICDTNLEGDLCISMDLNDIFELAMGQDPRDVINDMQELVHCLEGKVASIDKLPNGKFDVRFEIERYQLI